LIGTSVYPRKQGSTIPVKFTICDANGNPISDRNVVFPTTGDLSVINVVHGTVTQVDESSEYVVPDVQFRFSSGIWIMNLATGQFTAGYTYTFRINLADGSGILFTVGFK
jgi:hypothetical protein